MKITYDKEANAAYIYFKKVGGAVARTIPVTNDMIIDLGTKGEILGVEILNASFHIARKDLATPKKTLLPVAA